MASQRLLLAGRQEAVMPVVSRRRPMWTALPDKAGSGGVPAPAGAFITTPDIHLRGMNRNTVIIDGTRPGSPPCSSRKADQRFSATGANGVEVYRRSGTWVENLTVCNYLTNDAGANGNEIWWNGGQGSGRDRGGACLGGERSCTVE